MRPEMTEFDLRVIDAFDLLDARTHRSHVPEPVDARLPYGPRTATVRSMIEAIAGIPAEGMLRCAVVAERLGAKQVVGGTLEAVDRDAIARAADRTGLRAEVLAAFWDAGRACAERWCDPIFPQYYWNDRLREPVTSAAQLAAAASVLDDALDAAAQRTIANLWQAATGDWSSGALGPNQVRLLAFLDRLTRLSIGEARAIAAAWWPPDEDDSVWRTYDDPDARQVTVLRRVQDAAEEADPVLAFAVRELVRIRLGVAALEPADHHERITVVPKIHQAAEAAALGIAIGEHLDPATRSTVAFAFER